MEKLAPSESPAGIRGLALRTFSSLSYRNYRLFFAGQIISLIGSWMQNAAYSWLVYELTGSKLLLGTVAAIGVAPMVVFSTVGGIAAERFSKRNILLITQSSVMVLAFVLAALVLRGRIEVLQLMLLSALTGTVMAFDMPARQAFVVELVGLEHLSSGIALNSATFNSARIIGPAVAGLTMAGAKELFLLWHGAAPEQVASLFGMGLCFAANGLSFVAVIVALLMMRELPAPQPAREPALRLALGGFAEVGRNRQLLASFVLLAVMLTFGFSYALLMPVYARDIMSPGRLSREALYGLLISSVGVGAVVGALAVASLTGEMRRLRGAMLIGLGLLSVATAAFSLSRQPALSMGLLFLVGLGQISFMTSNNTFIQLSVTNAVRGRVMAVMTIAMGVTGPLANLQAGALAEWLGAPAALWIGAAIVGATSLCAAVLLRRLETPTALEQAMAPQRTPCDAPGQASEQAAADMRPE